MPDSNTELKFEEIEAILSSMWKKNRRREKNLITSWASARHGKTGGLGNEHWAFSVGYHFREALDMKFQELQKNLKKYYDWTQGPIINFKEGDSIPSKDGGILISVDYAMPMGWDTETESMYQGIVTFRCFEKGKNERWQACCTYTMSQMDFLRILVEGLPENQCNTCKTNEQMDLLMESL